MRTKLFSGTILVLFIMVLYFIPINAQEKEKTSPFSLGGDVVSSYVWRGSKIGTGPNIQPFLKFSAKRLTIGSWGSYSFHESGDLAETDLFGSYTFDCGLSLGLTDYFYQGFPLFKISDRTSSHALEINLGYAISKLSISANYIVNDASRGGPSNKPGGGDMYFEVKYAFENLEVFAGAGNGWHTLDKKDSKDVFMLCCIGMLVRKELKISDTYTLPVFGTLSINPDKEELNLVVGLSF